MIFESNGRHNIHISLDKDYLGDPDGDFNSSLGPNSHHNWNGTITMKKGKRKE